MNRPFLKWVYTETLIQTTHTNALIGVDVSVKGDKDRGYCTSLCFVTVSFILEESSPGDEDKKRVSNHISYPLTHMLRKHGQRE